MLFLATDAFVLIDLSWSLGSKCYHLQSLEVSMIELELSIGLTVHVNQE